MSDLVDLALEQLQDENWKHSQDMFLKALQNIDSVKPLESILSDL